jgi:hypothetical protein
MSIKVRTPYLAIIILALLASTFFVGKYLGSKKTDNALNGLILAKNRQIETYEVMLRDAKTFVTEKDQEVTTLKEAKKSLEVTNEELRKLNIRTLHELTRLNLQIDTMLDDISNMGIIIPINEPIVDNKPQNAIKLPFSFIKKDDWLDLKGDFDSKGKLAIGLKINAPIDIYTGWDNHKKTYKSVVTTTNPYIKVLYIKSQKFDVKKTNRYGVGLQAGYSLVLSNPVKLSPTLGLGISYNFIRW